MHFTATKKNSKSILVQTVTKRKDDNSMKFILSQYLTASGNTMTTVNLIIASQFYYRSI